VALSRDTIDAGYESVDAFLASGWELQDQMANRLLLARALDTDDDVSYLRRVLPMQWALARAARPRLTTYFDFVVAPDEADVYRSGEAVVHAALYVASEGIVQFSCALPEGQHIPGWQIYDLRTIVKARAMSDGRKADHVRVHFKDRWMAMSERRPLLDVGVEVFYYDEHGELVDVRD
jgi:hypothetical protein